MVRFTVNEVDHAVDDDARSLLDVLRDDLGLTGAKNACGEGQCGSCTVIVEGQPVFACITRMQEIDGARVRTVEGLSVDGTLHPVQAAFVDQRAMQCGYCTPGMVMRAVALLERDHNPDDETIASWFDTNICRCGGYPRIRAALHEATLPAAASADPAAVPAAASALSPPSERRWTANLRMDGDARDRSWGWTTPGGVRIDIDTDGRVHGYVGKVDGGQGNRWSLIRTIAAHLGVSTGLVELTMGDTALSPADLGTFGSRSTPDAGHALRITAAGLRRALLTDAATRWEVPVDRLTVADGMVRDTATDRTVSYSELVKAASRDIDVDPGDDVAPATVTADDVAAVRRGLAAAVTGAKQFPSDVTVPGMRHGRVLHPPAYGARLVRCDTSAARSVADAEVIESDGFVGVVALTRGIADDALQAIVAEWDVPDGPADADLEAYLRAHPAEQQEGRGGAVDHVAGDVDDARQGAATVVSATYTTAYIAHVPMELRVAVAAPDGEGLTVWLGTQRPYGVRAEVAAATGLGESQVRVVVPDFGGGFGGKHTGDVAVEAARLAHATGHPVRVAWTRKEEFRYGYLRPAAVIDMRTALSADARLLSWEFTNINSGAAGLMTPYDVKHRRIRFVPARAPLAQGSYRALAATANNFAGESHLDEIAAAAGVDPLDLRLQHLRDRRLAEVLRAAADAIGWGQSTDRMRPSDGVHVGIACGVEKDARVATAACVRLGTDGRARVTRLVTAFDCGAVIDPDGVRAQVTGATIMGLGGALFEAIRFDRGRILNAGLDGYRVPRMVDIPQIDVIVIDRPDVEPSGAGETPIISVAPAIANAVYAATGRRLRALPLDLDRDLRPNSG